MRHKALISIAGGILLVVIVGGITAAATASPFAGRWTSTDPGDGSSQALLVFRWLDAFGHVPGLLREQLCEPRVAVNSMDFRRSRRGRR